MCDKPKAHLSLCIYMCQNIRSFVKIEEALSKKLENNVICQNFHPKQIKYARSYFRS